MFPKMLCRRCKYSLFITDQRLSRSHPQMSFILEDNGIVDVVDKINFFFVCIVWMCQKL